MTLKSIALLAALCAPLAGFGQTAWVAIVKDAGGSIYADPQTVQEVGDQLRIWSLLDLNAPKTQLRSTRAQYAFRCALGDSQILSATMHTGSMGTGTLIPVNIKTPTPITVVTPEGSEWDLMVFACAQAKAVTSRWERFSSGKAQEPVMYFDRQSVVQSGALVTVKTLLNIGDTGGQFANKSLVITTSLQCAERKVALGDAYLHPAPNGYGPGQKNENTSEEARAWSDVAPGSSQEALLTAVCKSAP